MTRALAATSRLRRSLPTLSLLVLCGLLILGPQRSHAAPPARPTDAQKAAIRPTPRGSLLTSAAWQNVPLSLARPEEIDRLVATELRTDKIEPAPLTTDEQFLRRVTLDLTGELPVPADVNEFVADKTPNKRAKLIDKLLDSDEYAQHWSSYWRDVLTERLSDLRGRVLQRPFDDWMTDQLKNNKNWGDIVRAMLTAEGLCRFDDNGQHGANFFLASHIGADAASEQAAETSRVFLGIQIQCAQCHDHPFDQWKREQFHELAGYFARIRGRPVREGMRLAGFEIFSLPRGEHQMPHKDDPKKTTVMNPRFLDGKGPAPGASDRERRRVLAMAVTDPSNFWFASAFTNRLWGQLMGQAFCTPVDDMGPRKEVVLGSVLVRLASSFRASNYDVKGLLRLILNTQTYQRQLRPGENDGQHLHFAAAFPTRLGADALWESLVGVLGTIGGPGNGNPRPGQAMPFLFRPGFEGLFKAEFAFDPSQMTDDVEGSIPQALLLMNSPIINQRIQATGANLLARILKAYPHDDGALKMVYLRTLARKPTDRELQRCRDHVGKADKRAEAYEDILWALINSTEFQTRR